MISAEATQVSEVLIVPSVTSMSILRSLPRETRQQIFELSLIDNQTEKFHTNTYKTPALLVAVRRDPVLYKDALYVIYKTRRLYFTVKNFEELSNPIRHNAIKNVRHLGIDLVSVILSPNKVESNEKSVMDHLSFHTKRFLSFFGDGGCLAAANLETLQITFNVKLWFFSKICSLLESLSVDCQKLTTVIFIRRSPSPIENWEYTNRIEDGKDRNLIYDTNHFLGVNRKKEIVKRRGEQ